MWIRCLIVVAILSLSGCASLWSTQERGSSSSLVDFLYPDGNAREQQAATPAHLQLPLRVGLAFVPPNRHRGPLSAGERQQLLEQVAQRFRPRAFIDHIEIIPQHYLREPGFDTLRQIGRLHRLDVMALVSHDQLVAREDKELSLFYWTIVGAYVVPGTKNRVNTFVDTTVFDLHSGALLFRAPGVDHDDERSTAVESGGVGRKLSRQSFTRAVDNMTTALDHELDGFVAQVKSGKSNVAVAFRPGYGGSGNFLWGLIIMLASAFIISRRD